MHRPIACLVPALAVLCAGLVGCELSSGMVQSLPPMELYLDENAMKAEVLRYVAVGMPIDEAKKVMETHGFKCSCDRVARAARWMDADTAKQDEVYLICSKFKPQRNWLEDLCLSDEIKVYFSLKDDKVSEVHVDHISCCL